MPELEVCWRAFELRPEPVPTLDPSSEYLQVVWTRSVYPLAGRLRMKMRLPPVQPRSRLAHEAAAWARRQGCFEPMNEAIFRAFFERGVDIGKAELLSNLAVSIGLDGASLKMSLDRHEQLQEVLADEESAARYGVTAIPAFVSGDKMLLGVQSTRSLEHLLRESDH